MKRLSGGFSLVELMMSLVILTVILGGVVALLSSSMQTNTRTELRSDMYENVRGVAEMMSQEIGQSGLVSLPPSTLTSAAALGAQTVNVSSTTSMFVGEQVLVDAGNSEESVTLTAVTPTSITATFSKPHLLGAPINALGVFPTGIVPNVPVAGTVPINAPELSTPNVLNLYGDINADGSLVYVRYTCTPGTSAAPGTLTRSVTTIVPGANKISANQTLLTTVVGGVGAACFQYTTQTAAGFTFVTNVGFTLSVQATSPDPQTGAYATMTKSFLNLAPRNILAGLELAQAGGSANRLQQTPANVAAY
ncbi:MAG TPA: prepilin-type N-terminal cleavage/methylation domain-containing protein [Alphaproteobacteria bacterium]|nr:prepilin-type N-terminal cleavage/methylation domain-containing protein [Alphaproteobacteria bacterium]